MLLRRRRHLIAWALTLGCHERDNAAVAWTTTGNLVKMTTQPHKLHATTAVPDGDSTSDSPSTQRQRAVVVGGGPAGALMALSLAQGGTFEVDLLEASRESEISGPNVRSWNVVLFGRGSRALEAAGVDLHKEVRDIHHAK